MIIITAQQARCFYHPDRAAVEKCERCNRLICLEDKMIDRTYRGMDSADDIHVYCPVCYNEVKKQKEKTGKVLGPIFLIFFAGFLIVSIIISILFLIIIFNMMGNIPTP